MRGALSDQRMGLSFTIADGPRQRSHSRYSTLAGLMIVFYCLRFEIPPNPGGRVPICMSIYPRNTVARLYPHALGSLFVASYDT
jgi:hypothetical protein